MPDERVNTFTFRVSDTTECFIGWDPMLETFFGQVYRIDASGERVEEGLNGEDAGTICWVGTTQAEIRTVDHLARQLMSFATIPEDIRTRLFAIEID